MEVGWQRERVFVDVETSGLVLAKTMSSFFTNSIHGLGLA